MDREEPSRGRFAATNKLLQSLSDETQARLWPKLKRVTLPLGRVVESADWPIGHLFFIERGIVSLVKTMKDGRTVEVGAVGIEGLSDPSSIFDPDKALLESMVQVSGDALAISIDDLRSAMAESGELLGLLQEYVAVALSQIAQTSACNCLHPLEQRLCRWLLIAHDSALSDTFSLTQEFLAMMLGVARPSVSLAAQLFQRAGVIRYAHGSLTIVDRPALEESACECYATIRSQFDRLFAMRPRPLQASRAV